MPIDYGETLLQAVDVVVQSALNDLGYDKTIVCEITNIDNAKRGQYTVSDGSSSFFAYTDKQDYKLRDSVYVTIPQGDYNKQKMIIGKYIQTYSNYYTYSSPWEAFIDASGDLVPDDDRTWTIVANDPEGVMEKIVAEGNISNGSSYTMLGIKGSFKLASEAQYGNYGLNLYITYTKNSSSRTVKYTLDCADMYGNPFNFTNFYQQSKLFNIAELGQITNIRVGLFQNGQFENGQHEPISPADINLKDLYVALGYDLSNFNQDTLLLYTEDSEYYSPEDRTKHLHLRWIHLNENGSVSRVDDLTNAQIHWYRSSNNSSDKWAGQYWEEISKSQDSFDLTVEPVADLATTYYKAIIETPIYDDIVANASSSDREIKETYDAMKTAEVQYQQRKEAYDKLPTEENKKAYEKYKQMYESFFTTYTNAVNGYLVDLKLYESNELEFNNTISASELAIAQVAGLQIETESNIFYKYNDTGNLTNFADARKERELIATFGAGNQKAEKIIWKFPIYDTMIEYPQNGVEYNTVAGDVFSNTSGYGIITRQLYKPSGEISQDDLSVDLKQIFRIKSKYSPTYTDNTIYCTVVRNDVEYNTSIDMYFGISGNNGTDYTLIVEPVGDLKAFVDENGPDVALTSRVLDSYGNEVSGAIVKYELLPSENEINGVVPFSKDGALVRATASINEGTLLLTSYISIPWTKDVKYRMIGGDTIVYGENGNCKSYYRDEYIMRNAPEKEWSINPSFVRKKDEESGEWVDVKAFVGNYLTPPSIYFNPTDIYYLQYGDIWKQPLIIYQDKYENKLLNSWNGKTSIEDNSLMSQVIGAGTKGENNTFSGVLFGDVGKNTGLIGYKDGEQSFGFLDDGTGFIGKKGGGRIEFDGKNSTIQSASYNEKNDEDEDVGTGVKLDLDSSPFLSIKQEGKDIMKVSDDTFQINGSAEDSSMSINSNGNPYINITNNTGTLLEVSKEKFLIDSPNFSLKGVSQRDNYKTSSIELGGDKFLIINSVYKPENNSFTEYYAESEIVKPEPEPLKSIENIIVDIEPDGTFLLQSRDFGYYKQYTFGSDNDFRPQGTQIDLKSGTITSYGFDLTAFRADEPEGFIQINSGAKDCPFYLSGDVIPPQNTYELITGFEYADLFRNGTEFYIKTDTGYSPVDADSNPFQALKEKDSDTDSYYKRITDIENALASTSYPAIKTGNHLTAPLPVYNDAGEAYEFPDNGNPNQTEDERRAIQNNWQALQELIPKLTATAQEYISSSQNNYFKQVEKKTKETKIITMNWDGTLTANNLRAQGGLLGPFTIDSTSLYSSASSIGGSGVYVGKDGISVGAGQTASFIAYSGPVYDEVGNRKTITYNDYQKKQQTKEIGGGDVVISGNLYITGSIIGDKWAIASSTGGGSGGGTFSGFKGLGLNNMGSWKFNGDTLQYSGNNVIGWDGYQASFNKAVVNGTLGVNTVEALTSTGVISGQLGKMAFVDDVKKKLNITISARMFIPASYSKTIGIYEYNGSYYPDDYYNPGRDYDSGPIPGRTYQVSYSGGTQTVSITAQMTTKDFIIEPNDTGEESEIINLSNADFDTISGTT